MSIDVRNKDKGALPGAIVQVVGTTQGTVTNADGHAEITVPDLRGGFSHLIAALAAEGTSKVHGIGLIDRGYERFGDKLASLGAMVERT